MGHKGFRRSTCHAGGAAGAKAIGQGFGVTGICRFHRERVYAIRAASTSDFDTVAYKGGDRLIYHFYRRREAHAGSAADTARASRGGQRSGVFRGNGYILCRLYGSGAIALIFFFSDESFRIGLDIMGPGRSGTAKVRAATYRGCDGSEFFQGGGIHIHRPGILESHCIADGAIGVAGVFLYIHRRADTASRRERYAAGQAEEFRSALRIDGDITIVYIIGPFAQIGISILGNHIHCHRPGACELGRPERRANGHRLRRGVAVTIIGRAIVRIVCGNSERVCLGVGGLRISRHIGVIHHDGDRRTGCIISYSRIADAQSSGAMVRSIHRESAYIHTLIIHMGIGGRRNPISCAREGAAKSIARRRRSDDGRDITLFFRADLHVSTLRGSSAFKAFYRAVFHIGIGVAFDQVHRDGRPHRGARATARNSHRPGIGVNISLVRSRDRDRFVRFHRAILHMGIRHIIYPVQGNLTGHRIAAGRPAAAGCDVQDACFIVCGNRERLIDILAVSRLGFISGKGEICFFHIGFIGIGDGIVHEGAGDSIALPGIEAGGDGATHRADSTVIRRGHRQRVCGNRRSTGAIGHAYVGLRIVMDAVHRHIGCNRQAALALGCAITHAAILAGHLGNHSVRGRRKTAALPCHTVHQVFQLHAVFIRLVRRMEPSAAGHIFHIALFIIIGHTTGHSHRDDFAAILRLDAHIIVSLDGATGNIRFRIAHDVIVGHRGADARTAAGDGDTTGQVDIHGIVLGRHIDILTGSDYRISDTRLRFVIDALHAYGSVNGHRIRHTAGHRNRYIGSLRGAVDLHVLTGIDLGTVIDISIGGILLPHSQGCAAQTGLSRLIYRPAAGIEIFFDMRTHQ